MSATRVLVASGPGAPEGTDGRDLITGREVAKFGVLVGFLGIFYDAALAVFALVATVLGLVLEGVIVQGLTLREFPGITIFVVRALIAVAFYFWLASYIGLDTILHLATAAVAAFLAFAVDYDRVVDDRVEGT